jgi:uncharacterized DUF497 family protein
MELTWDEAKRRRTLEERGLDFAHAEQILDGLQYTRADNRRDYGEPRFVTVGYLAKRFVVVTWTPRDGTRRIISMRFGHADEEAYYQEYLG